MKLTTAFYTLIATALAVSATSHSIPSSQVTLIEDNDLEVPGENPLKYCEDPKDYILDIDEVLLDPNPPEAGKNLTINAKGTLSKPVKRGTLAHLLVKYGIVKILQKEVNICDEADNVDMKCPLDGTVELKKVVMIPKEIPPGRYNVVANVTTKDGDIVTCLQASVPFNLPGSFFGSNEL